MANNIETILKKNRLAIAIAMVSYPLWVGCDFAGTKGIALSDKEKIESIRDYQESGKLYRAFRIGHYIAMH